MYILLPFKTCDVEFNQHTIMNDDFSDLYAFKYICTFPKSLCWMLQSAQLNRSMLWSFFFTETWLCGAPSLGDFLISERSLNIHWKATGVLAVPHSASVRVVGTVARWRRWRRSSATGCPVEEWATVAMSPSFTLNSLTAHWELSKAIRAAR